MSEAKEKAKDEATGDEREQPGPPRGLLREYFESAVVTFIMAIFFMTFVAQAAGVPSASMQNTIYVGDRFLINKFIFGPESAASFLPQREVRRGDIIVFRYPAEKNPDPQVIRFKTYFIKRVIGMPGETVHVRGHEVYVNGRLLPEYRLGVRERRRPSNAEFRDLLAPQPRAGEPYTVYYDADVLTNPPRATPNTPLNYCVETPCVVPDGQYFVMGDNREDSADSREWGFVPRWLVVGRALFIIWSYDESAPRSDALPPFNFIVDFLSNTRWSRIGTMIR